MNNLDWLARNVHEWDADYSFLYRLTEDDHAWSQYHEVDRYNKAQWLARRAELQGKPSWEDVPEWVTHIAQYPTGQWALLKSARKPINSGWRANQICTTQGACGEVLGDWRDTLEKRPDMHENTVKITISDERVQKSAESVHNWFEEGELPPVGVECEIFKASSSKWIEVEVIGHRDGVAICWSHKAKCSIYSNDFEDFRPIRPIRPIRTVRDELIEIILSCNMSDGVLAGAILAAGFKRDGGVA